MQLVLGLSKRGFDKGEILKLENEGMKSVLFFIYGRADVVVKLEIGRKEEEYIIDLLEEMSFFGDYECVTGNATNLKVRGAITGGYYVMNFAEMVS